jgi:broad specificity phosphatase PhoE
MHVYFVRHGETDLNRRHLHQSPGTPLNAAGFDQARSVGEYLRPMNASLLITSTYERAAQTARVIGQSTGLTPVYSPHFREVERPSLFAEKSLFSLRTFWYILLTVIFRNRPRWRYYDGENLTDIFARVQQSFRTIEARTEEHGAIIVVSHSAYIALMVRYMCHDRRLSLMDLVRVFFSTNGLENCEVLHVEYVGPTVKGTCPWILHE